MNRHVPSPERPRTGEREHRDAADALTQWRLPQTERAIAMQVTASRILWSYAADECEPDGGES